MRRLRWILAAGLAFAIVACGTTSTKKKSSGDAGGAESDEGGFVFDPDAMGSGNDALPPPPEDGTILPGGCTTDADCSPDVPHCRGDGLCVKCLVAGDCTGNEVCHDGKCLGCQPGQRICQGKDVYECNALATGFDPVGTCSATCANGACLECYPGTKECKDGKSMSCKADGSGHDLLQDCALAGIPCNEGLGVCMSPCSGDVKFNTNAGCGFYAVDLDNAKDTGGDGQVYDASSAQFAIIASNTSSTATAKVTVTMPDGKTQEENVGPLSLATFKLPSKFGIEGSSRTKNTYKVDSTSPITVYQFNPLSNEGVFSNDASVLLPANALGNEYYVTSQKQSAGNSTKYRGYMTLVGVSDVAVDVTVTPTASTLAGTDVPAMSAGQSSTFNLARGEVINIESADDGGDLTGSHIEANGPVQVFSGHEAALSGGGVCCADHLEEQMIPVAAWGKEYVVTRSVPRGKEKDWFRVIAANPGTQVTINPNVAGSPILSLGAGQWKEFSSDSHFKVTANQPVLVMQYLASSFEILGGGAGGCGSDSDCGPSGSCDPFGGVCLCQTAANCPAGHTCVQEIGGKYCEPIGDPSLILVPPTEQWRQSYVFLTPDSYLVDYVNIVGYEGSTVTLDGSVVPEGSWEAIPGAAGFRVYRIKLGDGVHTVSSDSPTTPISIVVYGYDDDVSYGYVGGLGLANLNK